MEKVKVLKRWTFVVGLYEIPDLLTKTQGSHTSCIKMIGIGVCLIF